VIGRSPSTTVIRVLVVEDNFYTRFGTVAFLREQPGIEIVGEAADGEQALERYAELRPDVLVVDLRMPRMNGNRLIASLCRRVPTARILVLTHYLGDEDIFQALRAGARGYLTKESTGKELLMAIRAVYAGEQFFPPEIVENMSSRQGQPGLTRRERQVLQEIAEGASNREVGKTLGISTGTAALYVSSILSKLGACSRTEAVSIARRRGLLRSTPP